MSKTKIYPEAKPKDLVVLIFKSLPNALTFSRLLLCPIIAYFLLANRFQAALILFVIASFTDLLDGYLARKLNAETALGRMLDPICDKVYLVTLFTTLMTKGLCPAWFVGLQFAIAMLLCAGYALLRLPRWDRKTPIYPSFLGKWNTALHLFWLGVVFLSLLGQTAIAQVISTLGYIGLSIMQIAVFYGYYLKFSPLVIPDLRVLARPKN